MSTFLNTFWIIGKSYQSHKAPGKDENKSNETKMPLIWFTPNTCSRQTSQGLSHLVRPLLLRCLRPYVNRALLAYILHVLMKVYAYGEIAKYSEMINKYMPMRQHMDALYILNATRFTNEK